MCEQNAVMGKGQMRQPVLGDVVSSIARMTQISGQHRNGLRTGAHSTEACESLKTLLYRAIQDVPLP